jgi:hypothetical protein
MIATVKEAEAALAAAQHAATQANAAVSVARHALTRAKKAEAEQREREKKNKVNRDRATAKRKAERLGVTIDPERFPDGWVYWVLPPKGMYPDHADDPLEGNRSCHHWSEVLANVEVYEKAIAEREAANNQQDATQ